MSCLEYLIAADRVVLAGLSAYDHATGRVFEEHRRLMKQLGHSADEIAAAEQEHIDRVRAGRGKLHRELWTKVLARLAAEQPQAADSQAN